MDENLLETLERQIIKLKNAKMVAMKGVFCSHVLTKSNPSGERYLYIDQSGEEGEEVIFFKVLFPQEKHQQNPINLREKDKQTSFKIHIMGFA